MSPSGSFLPFDELLHNGKVCNRIEIFFKQFYNGQYKDEDVDVGDHSNKLEIDENNERAVVKAKTFYQSRLMYDASYKECMLDGDDITYSPPTQNNEENVDIPPVLRKKKGWKSEEDEDNKNVMVWKGNYRRNLREGWFEAEYDRSSGSNTQVSQSNDNQQNYQRELRFVHYHRGLRNGYAYTITDLKYTTYSLDTTVNIHFSKYTLSDGYFLRRDSGMVNGAIKAIDYYVNGLREGYQYVFLGNGTLESMDFYKSGEMVKEKSYSFLGANVCVPRSMFEGENEKEKKEGEEKEKEKEKKEVGLDLWIP